MALSLGQTGTADSVDAEYFNWESSDRRFMIHMHLDAIDGLARDLIEGVPREVGGILLGQVGRGERPVVWIERYQRVETGQRQGTSFVLDDEDHAAFERAARSLSDNGELTVVGYYRTHLRPGFQLEDPDRELISRYFADTEDVVLLLRPEKNKADILAQFFGRDSDAGSPFHVLGPAFPFRGRAVGLESTATSEDDPKERTAKTLIPSPIPGARGAVAQRRLVPDFQPAPESQKSAREFFMEARPYAAPPEPEPEAARHSLARWWPLLAAILLVAAGIAAMLQQSARRETATAPVRPLGLDVDPSGPNWRVSWNTSAVPAGARVKLFVRDGDQSQIDLQPPDLQSGTYTYAAKGRDVTLRLEVVDKEGHLGAESFRVLEPAPPAAAAAVEKPAEAQQRPQPQSTFTAPKATHRVAPVVPASLRPRIHGSVPMDIRVKVDAKGRVSSAIPVSKPHAGVESFLAARAVYAAKQWRFEPARRDGQPVEGAEIIHFVFDK